VFTVTVSSLGGAVSSSDVQVSRDSCYVITTITRRVSSTKHNTRQDDTILYYTRSKTEYSQLLVCRTTSKT